MARREKYPEILFRADLLLVWNLLSYWLASMDVIAPRKCVQIIKTRAISSYRKPVLASNEEVSLMVSA